MENKYHLRSSKPEDLSFVKKYEKIYSKEGYVANWTEEQHVSAIKNPMSHHLIIECGEPIGYCIMNLDYHDNLELMRLVINKPNEGHGRHVLELLKTYAFEHVKCHRLWLDVRVHNERGISVYKRHQFVEEGTLRQCIKHNNGYYSIKIMSILKEEYEA